MLRFLLRPITILDSKIRGYFRARRKAKRRAQRLARREAEREEQEFAALYMEGVNKAWARVAAVRNGFSAETGESLLPQFDGDGFAVAAFLEDNAAKLRAENVRPS
jgi:hypothetical protein